MDREFMIMFVGVVAVTYASRVAGLYAGGRELSDRSQRILAYVPIGAFAAIVTLGFTGSGGELDARIPAAILAVLLAIRNKPLWLCLIAGLAVYGVIRTITG
jgi:branched-subunit amino acid transport protein